MTDEEEPKPLIKAKDHKYPGYEQESNKEWKENFYFIQAADTQFGLIDDWANVPVEKQTWDEDIRLTELAIKHANTLNPKPKFFIVCGDMINAGPGQIYRGEQENDFKRIFEQLDSDIPLVCVCGNHDIGNSPTVETVATYRNMFGDDYFSFWIDGVLFLALNSQYYEDHSQVEDEYTQQELWLDQQLELVKLKQCQHCVVFQHIPWFLKDANEEKDYFNIEINTRLRMLNKLRDAGVRHIFCGHYHRNAGGFYGDLELVVTSAVGCQIGKDVSGIRLVKVTKDKIEHKYYGVEDENFPKTIELDGDCKLP